MQLGTADQQVSMYDTTGADMSYYQLDITDFPCNDGTAVCTLNANVPETGQPGDCTDFEGTSDDGVDMSCTYLELPKGTAPGASMFDNADDAGKAYIETDAPSGDQILVVQGTTLRSAAGRYLAVGGDGSDGPFTFDGACTQGASCCPSTVGAVTGSGTTKTCTLIANSIAARSPNDAGVTLYSCEYNFSSFTYSGTGTLTCDVATAPAFNSVPTWGAMLILRVSGAVSITGGTIDMSGRGFTAGAGGSTTTTGTARAGGNGSGNSFFPVASAPAAGDTNGTTGHATPATTPRLWPMQPYFNLIGTGGGGGAASGVNGSAGNGLALATYGSSTPFIGGIGGSGAGCSASATAAAGGNGGRGGGGILFESPTYTCSGATFTVAGINGAASPAAAGGGGGGGGIVMLVSRDLTGTDSCTYTVGGGTGATEGQAACATGGTGGTGRKWAFTAPQ
jgi:hypothetical protein